MMATTVVTNQPHLSNAAAQVQSAQFSIYGEKNVHASPPPHPWKAQVRQSLAQFTPEAPETSGGHAAPSVKFPDARQWPQLKWRRACCTNFLDIYTWLRLSYR